MGRQALIRGWMILGVLLLAVGAAAGLTGLLLVFIPGTKDGVYEFFMFVAIWLSALGTGSIGIDIAQDLEHRRK